MSYGRSVVERGKEGKGEEERKMGSKTGERKGRKYIRNVE